MQQFVFEEDREAAEYWAQFEWKKWTVSVQAGPAKRPTFKAVMFVRARTAEGAIGCARRNLIRRVAGARFYAHLATARELGCVKTPKLQVRD